MSKITLTKLSNTQTTVKLEKPKAISKKLEFTTEKFHHEEALEKYFFVGETVIVDENGRWVTKVTSFFQ